jgi:hypothetical protein
LRPFPVDSILGSIYNEQIISEYMGDTQAVAVSGYGPGALLCGGYFMKRLILILAASILALGLVAPARAVEIKVGVAAMYDLWKPAYLPFECDAKGGGANRMNDYSLQGSFMVGPTFQATIKDGWSLGLQGLFGTNKNRYNYSSSNAANYLNGMTLFWPVYAIETGNIEIWKTDIDTVAERTLNKYFCLLLGVRFSYNESDGKGHLYDFAYGIFSPINHTSTSWYLGPSAGIGFHAEIYKGLTVGCGLSALVQGGELKLSKIIPVLWFFAPPRDYKIGHIDIGPDAYVKLAYFIEPAGVEVWIGGRYIYQVTVMTNEHGGMGTDHPGDTRWMKSSQEHFGGVTFGASYNFAIK